MIEINDRFASSLRLSKDAIVIIDRDAKILVFNPAAENMFGLSADEAIGQSMPDKLIPPRLRNAHKKGFENYLQTGEANILGATIETQSLRADGSEFPVELTVQESYKIDSMEASRGPPRQVRQRSGNAAHLSNRRARGPVAQSECDGPECTSLDPRM